MNCLNCDTKYDGNFCPECGQKSSVKQITLSFLISDFFSRFMDIDKGMLYNLNNITIAPKDTILNYLEGKRKNVFNPVSYAIVAVTIYLIIQSLFKIKTIEVPNIIGDGKLHETSSLSYEAGKLVGTYLKFFWLLNIIFLSLFTRIFFKRFNFLEHLTINCFLVGHATLFGIITLFITEIQIVFNPLVFAYLLFLLIAVFKTKGDLFETIVACCFSMFFSYLLFYIIPFIFVWVNI